jgi:hypothetical protein
VERNRTCNAWLIGCGVPLDHVARDAGGIHRHTAMSVAADRGGSKGNNRERYVSTTASGRCVN